MMINKEFYNFIDESMSRKDIESRLAEVKEILKNPSPGLLAAAVPVLEEEQKELERYLSKY